jgi:V/A-type H+/Na+-transporting ATPase subunit D
MAELKLTKFELRHQQVRLAQLSRYLPTLQLRKALLQAEVIAAKSRLEELQKAFDKAWNCLVSEASLLNLDSSLHLEEAVRISSIEKGSENIAGVDLPVIQNIQFSPMKYDLFDTPAWIDLLVEKLQACKTLAITRDNGKERLQMLIVELRQVFTRVNLFEKVLIPRCQRNIKTIKIYIGDLLLAAVSQAKVAKAKIVARALHEDAV